jgi:hypothetical protein
MAFSAYPRVRSEAKTLGSGPCFAINPERVCQSRNPFRVQWLFSAYPRVRSETKTLGSGPCFASTLKGFASRGTLSGFNGSSLLTPGLSLRSNPGLRIANAIGVNFKRAEDSERLRRKFQTGLRIANAFGVISNWAEDSERLRRKF